jgi:hypothetical protein
VHDDTLLPEQRNLHHHQEEFEEVEEEDLEDEGLDEEEPFDLQAASHVHSDALSSEKRSSEHKTESKVKCKLSTVRLIGTSYNWKLTAQGTEHSDRAPV